MSSQQDWLDEARIRQARKHRMQGEVRGCWSIPYSKCNPYGHLRKRKKTRERWSWRKLADLRQTRPSQRSLKRIRSFLIVLQFYIEELQKEEGEPLWPWEIQYFSVLRARQRSLHIWSSALNMKNHPDNPRNIFSPSVVVIITKRRSDRKVPSGVAQDTLSSKWIRLPAVIARITQMDWGISIFIPR